MNRCKSGVTEPKSVTDEAVTSNGERHERASEGGRPMVRSARMARWWA
jgi:hypothetical protein